MTLTNAPYPFSIWFTNSPRRPRLVLQNIESREIIAHFMPTPEGKQKAYKRACKLAEALTA